MNMSCFPIITTLVLWDPVWFRIVVLKTRSDTKSFVNTTFLILSHLVKVYCPSVVFLHLLCLVMSPYKFRGTGSPVIKHVVGR